MEKLSYGGIDVSKDRLDVVVLPEGWLFSVSTDTAGWAELVARLHPLAVSAVGLEPSGGYERGIIRALLAAGLSVRRINPNKLRQFARARGILAKNDRLDARLIAEYVAIMPTRVVQRDDAVERLAEIVTMRRQLCDEHVAVDNQAAHLEDAMLRRLSKRRLVRLEADIRLLDKRLAEMVATNAAFSALRAAHFDARRRPGAGLHAHRPATRTREDEPQADRRPRRSRSIRLRQWQAQGTPKYLRWSDADP